MLVAISLFNLGFFKKSFILNHCHILQLNKTLSLNPKLETNIILIKCLDVV